MFKPETIFGNAWDVLAQMPDKCVDAIISDPLYDEDLGPEAMNELRRVCKGNIILFCNPQNRYTGIRADEIAFWMKPTSTKNYSRHIGRFVEEILIERNGDTFNSGLHWSNYTGVYTDLVLRGHHPFSKPVSLISRLIEIYTRPGDIILDPFMGGGTTLIAAQLTGRQSIGIEFILSTYQVVLDRLASEVYD